MWFQVVVMKETTTKGFAGYESDTAITPLSLELRAATLGGKTTPSV